jgi:hypothetical protein
MEFKKEVTMKPETIKIDEIEYIRRDSIKPEVLSVQDHPYEIGKIYLIRTVTMIDTGRVVAVTQQEIVLEDAAWIANTGRFAQAVEKAEFNEVEPFPNGRVIINRGAVVDAVQITKSQRSQK